MSARAGEGPLLPSLQKVNPRQYPIALTTTKLSWLTLYNGPTPVGKNGDGILLSPPVIRRKDPRFESGSHDGTFPLNKLKFSFSSSLRHSKDASYLDNLCLHRLMDSGKTTDVASILTESSHGPPNFFPLNGESNGPTGGCTLCRCG